MPDAVWLPVFNLLGHSAAIELHHIRAGDLSHRNYPFRVKYVGFIYRCRDEEMRSSAFAILVLFAAGIAHAGDGQSAPRRSIFAPQETGKFIKICKGCGCRGGGGYRLPNGKCAPR